MSLTIQECDNSMRDNFSCKYNLVCFLIKVTVAARAQEHGRHPAATGSSISDNFTTTRCFSLTKFKVVADTKQPWHQGTGESSLYSLKTFLVQTPSPGEPLLALMSLHIRTQLFLE